MERKRTCPSTGTHACGDWRGALARLVVWARLGTTYAGLLAALAVAVALARPAQAAETWTYTALGDSIGAGLWAPSGDGYVPRYAAHVAADAGATVALTNLSVPGWKSADLLSALKNDAAMRKAVATSQVVTWDIGGNDMIAARAKFKEGTCGGTDNQDCLRGALAAFKTNWNGIVREIRTLRAGQPTIYRTFSLYNPWVDEDRADGSLAVLKPYLDAGNAHICGAASQAAGGYRCADVYTRFNGRLHSIDPARLGLLAFDDLHPNQAGHAAIAGSLRALGYAPLR